MNEETPNKIKQEETLQSIKLRKYLRMYIAREKKLRNKSYNARIKKERKEKYAIECQQESDTEDIQEDETNQKVECEDK